MLAQGLPHGIDRFLSLVISELVQLPRPGPAVFSEGIIDNGTIVLDVTAKIQPSEL
jgi:hypothetical protein